LAPDQNLDLESDLAFLRNVALQVKNFVIKFNGHCLNNFSTFVNLCKLLTDKIKLITFLAYSLVYLYF